MNGGNVDWARAWQWTKSAAWFSTQTIVLCAAAVVLGWGVKGCSSPIPIPTPTPVADISLPETVAGQPGAPVDISAVTKGKIVKWSVPEGVYVRPGLTPLDAWLVAPAKGRYKVLAWTCTEKGPTEAAVSWFIVGDAPPGPGPGPGPSPGPAPIQAPGLRVMYVYEAKNLSKYPPGQLEAMYSAQVTQYLQQHCVKVNGQPEVRHYDAMTDLHNESKLWQDALARSRKSLPWLVVNNPPDKGWYEGPVPDSPEKMLELVKKYE